MDKKVIRYTDQDLQEFKEIIVKKKERVLQDLENLSESIKELSENSSEDYGSNFMEGSNTNMEIELLSTMMNRQQKYLNDLENALTRIENKTYGICSVTGKLIDKNRLKAVPNTTKSIEGKNLLSQQKNNTVSDKKNTVKKKSKNSTLTKVIKPKINTDQVSKFPNDEFELDEEIWNESDEISMADLDILDENVNNFDDNE